jgi:flavin reductase (DIM6/NTAB) family NADH-FMN oxidoreductase RutF
MSDRARVPEPVGPTGEGVASAVESCAFREAIARFATGVTLVTTFTPDGTPVGCTANSVASVSLAPPLLLVCLRRESESLVVIERTGRFGVSVLPEGREDVARRFAGEGRGDRFQGIELRADSPGTPLLVDVASWMDCRVWNTLQASDHTILIGEVVACGVGDRSPLIFFASRFGAFEPRPLRP